MTTTALLFVAPDSGRVTELRGEIHWLEMVNTYGTLVCRFFRIRRTLSAFRSL